MTYVNELRGVKAPAGVKYLNELWRYRSLCFNLVGADLRSRFRRSHLGLVWAGIQPLAFALLVSIVWSTVFEQSLVGFSVYVLSGMIVWEYISNVVMASQDSLAASEGYLKQGRVPYLVFQMRTPLAGMATFLIGYAVLIGLMLALGQLPTPGYHLLYALAFPPLLFSFVAPLACIFSLLGTHLRDMRHAMTIVLQAVFFLSPIIVMREYLDTEQLQFLKYFNPIIPLLDLFRLPLSTGTAWTMEALYIVLAWIGGLHAVTIMLSIRFGRRLIFAL